MITPLAVQQPWQQGTTSKDQAPAYMSARGKQSQATRTLTARAPCVKKCVCVCVCMCNYYNSDCALAVSGQTGTSIADSFNKFVGMHSCRVCSHRYSRCALTKTQPNYHHAAVHGRRPSTQRSIHFKRSMTLQPQP